MMISLPNEIIEEIIKLLPQADKITLMKVSKKMKQIAVSDRCWKTLIIGNSKCDMKYSNLKPILQMFVR